MKSQTKFFTTNVPKQKETHENMSLGPNCVDRDRPFQEILTRLCGTNFCINCTMLAYIAPSFVQQKTVPNAPEQEETHKNMSLGSNGVDRERLIRKILTRHRCTKFCINCTSLTRFAPSFVLQRNGSKWTQLERNAPKHEFRVKWCGSGAFVAKNSSAISWHELLH